MTFVLDALWFRRLAFSLELSSNVCGCTKYTDKNKLVEIFVVFLFTKCWVKFKIFVEISKCSTIFLENNVKPIFLCVSVCVLRHTAIKRYSRIHSLQYHLPPRLWSWSDLIVFLCQSIVIYTQISTVWKWIVPSFYGFCCFFIILIYKFDGSAENCVA